MFVKTGLKTLKSRDQQVFQAAEAPKCPSQALGTDREREQGSGNRGKTKDSRAHAPE